MNVSVRCLCGASCKVDTRDRMPHIDQRAIATRLVTKERGWAYEGHPMGKSTITMTCLDCQKKHGPRLHLDADYLPTEAKPGTFEEDKEP